MTRKWILVAAARPNFMKIAPLIRAIAAYNSANPESIRPLLVHTGQHYDDNMSEAFFRDLNIPAPDVHLGIGSGSHAEQTGGVLIEFEKVLLREKPDLVIVVGDVNSTLACALAAVKLHIPVAHVEAGLRSFDRTMPEEINRLLTDAVADYLFTPSLDGDENLLREGIPREKIFLVGDIMVDSLLFNLEKAKKTDILERLGLKNSPYALLTLHRPVNVDSPETFGRIVVGLRQVAERIPILFPVHPRTRKQITIFGLEDAFAFHLAPDLQREAYYAPLTHASDGQPPSPRADTGGRWERELQPRVHAFEPLGYLDFLNLMAHSRLVFTDSGGIQEETTVLNIPCITIRDTTERPVTLTEGTNVLVAADAVQILREANRALDGQTRRSHCPAIWDGHTAERIVHILAENIKNRK